MIILLNSSFEKKSYPPIGKTVECYSRYCVFAFRPGGDWKESSNMIPAFFILTTFCKTESMGESYPPRNSRKKNRDGNEINNRNPGNIRHADDRGQLPCGALNPLFDTGTVFYGLAKEVCASQLGCTRCVDFSDCFTQFKISVAAAHEYGCV